MYLILQNHNRVKVIWATAPQTNFLFIAIHQSMDVDLLPATAVYAKMVRFARYISKE